MARPKKTEIKENPPVEVEVKKPKGTFYHAHGRRKTATARVRLYPGKGEITVNGKPVSEYFSGEVAKILYERPFRLTDTLGRFDTSIKVVGSGLSSQLQAVAHGISKALLEIVPDARPVLKKDKLLRRDPRAKERRKYGLAQKARKGKQSPKR